MARTDLRHTLPGVVGAPEASTIRYWLIGGGALAMLCLMLAAPAFACSPMASAAVSPLQGDASSVVTVRGTQFLAEHPIQVQWGSTEGPVLAVGQTNEAGTFSIDVVVPADAAPGTHAIWARQGGEEIRSRHVRFTVLGGEPEPEPAPEPVARPAPQPAPAPEPVARPAPEPAPEPVARPAPEPAPAPEPVVQPAPAPVAGPTTQPQADPEPQPAAPVPDRSEPVTAPRASAPPRGTPQPASASWATTTPNEPLEAALPAATGLSPEARQLLSSGARQHTAAESLTPADRRLLATAPVDDPAVAALPASDGTYARPPEADLGRSPWALAPLVLAGLVVLATGGAAVVVQSARRTQTAAERRHRRRIHS